MDLARLRRLNQNTNPTSVAEVATLPAARTPVSTTPIRIISPSRFSTYACQRISQTIPVAEVATLSPSLTNDLRTYHKPSPADSVAEVATLSTATSLAPFAHSSSEKGRSQRPQKTNATFDRSSECTHNHPQPPRGSWPLFSSFS